MGGKDRRRGEPRFDFLLSAAKRDTNAAKRLFGEALSAASHPQPRVINTDLAPIYNSAIPALRRHATTPPSSSTRPILDILEQDHRAIKRRVNAKQGFREFRGSTKHSGLSSDNIMRKGQVRWVKETTLSVRSGSSETLFGVVA